MEKDPRGEGLRLFRRATPTPTVTRPRSTTGNPPRSTGTAAGAFLKINGSTFSYGATPNVMLHGINFSNEPADSCSNGGSPDITRINYNNDDYARVSSWGGNVVRFNMDYGWYTANRGQFFAVIDRHVQWAKANHLWLIPSMGSAPGGGCDFHQTGLWGNQGNQNLLASFWQDFASHYANEPTIAGYDMLNEPGAPSDGDWQVFGQRLRDTITAVDHNHFVVYEATKNDSPPLRGNNVVYSDHDYPGSEAYPQSWPRSSPLLIGEFGSQPTDNGPIGWVQNQIARYRSDGVHWTFFVMREGSNGFGLYACGGAGDFRCPWGEMILIVQQGMAGSVKP